MTPRSHGHEPVMLVKTIEQAVSISGHEAWEFVSSLAYAEDVVVQELLRDSQKLVDSVGRKRKVTQQSHVQSQMTGIEGGGVGGASDASAWVHAKNGWNEWFHPPSARTYYHNPSTGMTQWNTPHASVSVVQRTHQQGRLDEAQEQQQHVQKQMQEQTSTRNVTDEEVVVAIRELVVTRPDINAKNIRKILKAVNKFNVSITRIRNVRLRFGI